MLRKIFTPLTTTGILTLGIGYGTWLFMGNPSLENFISLDEEIVHAIPYEGGRSKLPSDKLIAIDKLLKTSVADYLECKGNDNMGHITAAIPVSILKNRFDQARRNPRRQLCQWASLDPFKDMPREQRLVQTRQFPNPSQGEALEYFRENFEPSSQYREWERTRMENALYAIAGDPLIRDKAGQWKSQHEYQNLADAEEQHRLKKDILQRVSDLLRESFGLPPVAVMLHAFKENDESLGRYLLNTDQIAINYHWRHDLTRSFENALPAIIEESKHSIDYAIMAQFANNEFSPEDIRAGHAAAMWLNSKQMVPYTEEGYKEQYVERNAKVFSRALARKITEALCCEDVPEVNYARKGPNLS